MTAKNLTAADLSERFGMSPRYWTRLAQQGKLPGAWQPSGEKGQWLFDEDAFQRWRNSTMKKVKEWPGYTKEVKSGGRAPSVTGRNTERPLEQEIDGWLKSAIGNG